MHKNDQWIAQKIRAQYTKQPRTSLDELRTLDAKVKRPAVVFAYVLGCISALIMGCGMSLIMTDIGAPLGMTSTMLPGVLIGACGLLMALLNYPIYRYVLRSRKNTYAPEILSLSETLLNANYT